MGFQLCCACTSIQSTYFKTRKGFQKPYLRFWYFTCATFQKCFVKRSVWAFKYTNLVYKLISKNCITLLKSILRLCSYTFSLYNVQESTDIFQRRCLFYWRFFPFKMSRCEQSKLIPFGVWCCWTFLSQKARWWGPIKKSKELLSSASFYLNWLCLKWAIWAKTCLRPVPSE